jgi:hypothetical protein
MKIIIFTLVPVIILALLNNKGFLPNTFYYILLMIVSAIGAYFFWFRFASIIMRDNMNYQEYNWRFVPPPSVGAVNTTDPWAGYDLPGTCIGQYCCSDGQTYDTTLDKCISPSTTTVTESFLTESMVSQVLTKKEPNKYKQDYKMGNDYTGKESDSFINNSKIK